MQRLLPMTSKSRKVTYGHYGYYRQRSSLEGEKERVRLVGPNVLCPIV